MTQAADLLRWTGMELCYGYNSTGPTFGAIMLSGINAAIEAIRVLDTYRSSELKKKGQGS